MLKHYVEYLFTGLFLCETSVKEVKKQDVKAVDIPNPFCVAFRFFDRNVIVIDGETLQGERKNQTGWYYYGQKMTLEQVKANYGNDHSHDSLISNMEDNGYKAVVKTKFDQFLPLEDKDTVL